MSIYTSAKQKFGRILGFKESLNDIMGTPIPPDILMGYQGATPSLSYQFYGREYYPDRSSTLRSIQQFDIIRNFCRVMYETNPNAAGLVQGMTNYIIGNGLNIKVDGESIRLVKQVQTLLDDFADENNLDEWVDESFIRAHVDGECFLRIYPSETITSIRAIEADFIRPPASEDHNGPWSFGIKSEPLDWQTIIAYCITQSNGDEEIVPEYFIHHLKMNSKRNTKRGVSSLYASLDELKGVDMLREATLIGERIRNSIAYVRQFAQASQSTIVSMNDNNKTGTWNGTQTDINYKKINPGEVVDVPKGLEFIPPPESSNTELSSKIMTDALASVAARFQIPCWLVSGSVEASSYASSLTAESPFLKCILRQQRIMSKYWKCILEDVIEIEVEKGGLPQDTLEKINLNLTFPSPEARSSKEQIDAQKVLVDARIMSKQTWAGLNNLDLEDEETTIENEEPAPTSQDSQNSQNSQVEGGPVTTSGKMQAILPKSNQ